MDTLCEICDSTNDVKNTDVKLMCCAECREFFGFEAQADELEASLPFSDDDIHELTDAELQALGVDRQADEFADYRREQKYGKQL